MLRWPTIKRALVGYGFAAAFGLAGLNHFLDPDFYLLIIPPYLPAHDWINALAGIAEMLSATVMLRPATARWGSWLAIATLVAVFPANVYLFQNQQLLPIPPLAHLLRLPLQAALIYWAYRAGVELARPICRRAASG
jgi:uncharacterized membrane protein